MLLAALLTALDRSLMLAVGCLALCAFSLWRYCALRWEATKRVYEFYLLLQSPVPIDRDARAGLRASRPT